MKIIVNNISQTFNKSSPLEFQALKNVSSVINQGEYVAIIGETGSGKTTFIEHLNSLLIPDEGTINWIFQHDVILKKNKFISNQKSSMRRVWNEEYKQQVKNNNLTLSKHDFINNKTAEYEAEHLTTSFNKENISLITNNNIVLKKRWNNKFKKSKIIRQHVGVVFQFAEYQLFESTIEKDIMFGPMAFGVSKEVAKQRAAKYLEQVGLPYEYLEKNPLDLSGGQKRRVALAGILAIEPDVLILDEPTAGLDPAGVREILEIFDKLNLAGKTVIMVTHDLNNVLERTHRTIVFSHGQNVLDDKTFNILNNPNYVTKYNLATPQVIDFANKLISKRPNLVVPELTSIEDLVAWIETLLNNQNAQDGGSNA